MVLLLRLVAVVARVAGFVVTTEANAVDDLNGEVSKTSVVIFFSHSPRLQVMVLCSLPK